GRFQAFAASGGPFAPYFGIFNRRFGTPVRVNVMSGIASTLFCVVAVAFFKSGADSTFAVVLAIAISTTLISYLWIFPAVLKLRYAYPNVRRPYVFPFGKAGIWAGTAIVTLLILLGSWASVFPGTLEHLFGVPYHFKATWGVSRIKFEAYTFGTLGIIVAVGVIGYVLGAPTRRQTVDTPLEAAEGLAATLPV